MDKIRLGVIGCGARGRSVVSTFLREGKGRVAVAAAFDPEAEQLKKSRECWQENFRIADSAETLILDPDVNLVMIFTPNAYHCSGILASLNAGKRVFSEKPLATTFADCSRIVKAQKESGIPVYTGFVLRYSPIYRKVKELLDSGTFGNIINIAASENRESSGGGNSMASLDGWRRFRKESGPYLLEKCSHDLDLLNWFAGGVPDSVAGFGGLDYFIPGYSGLWDRLDHDIYAKWVPEEKRINPFTSEKDIYDNHAVIMQYPGGIKMSFQLTLANAIPERRMYLSCTEGTIVCECFSGCLTYKRYTDDHSVTLKYAGDGHGGGDRFMAMEIIENLLSGKGKIVSGVQNGCDCALVALAADESMRTGRIVRLADYKNV